jgi:hypothetical protein
MMGYASDDRSALNGLARQAMAPPAMAEEKPTSNGGDGLGASSGNYGKTLGYNAVFRGASHSRK